MSIVRTSPFVQGLSGKSGNAVYVRSPYGTILRSRPMVWNEPSQAQIAASTRMAKVARAWSSLTLAQAAAWKRYAADLTRTSPPAGDAPPPSGQQVFVRYGTKLLQIDPHAPIPPDPPADAFLGDDVILDAEPAPGGILFTPTHPNGPDVVTELLLQPLRSVHRRTYASKYRHAAFVPFTSSPHLLPAKPGIYAVAYRFLRPATGQETGLAEAGVVSVEG